MFNSAAFPESDGTKRLRESGGGTPENAGRQGERFEIIFENRRFRPILRPNVFRRTRPPCILTLLPDDGVGGRKNRSIVSRVAFNLAVNAYTRARTRNYRSVLRIKTGGAGVGGGVRRRRRRPRIFPKEIVVSCSDAQNKHVGGTVSRVRNR